MFVQIPGGMSSTVCNPGNHTDLLSSLVYLLFEFRGSSGVVVEILIVIYQVLTFLGFLPLQLFVLLLMKPYGYYKQLVTDLFVLPMIYSCPALGRDIDV